MRKLYKVTSADGKTLKNYQWTQGKVETKPTTMFPRCCTSAVLHAFSSKTQIKGFLDYFSKHGPYNKFPVMLIWEAQGQVVVKSFSKVGCSALKLTKIVGVIRDGKIHMFGGK